MPSTLYVAIFIGFSCADNFLPFTVRATRFPHPRRDFPSRPGLHDQRPLKNKETRSITAAGVGVPGDPLVNRAGLPSPVIVAFISVLPGGCNTSKKAV